VIRIGVSDEERLYDINRCLERDVVSVLTRVNTPAFVYLDAVLEANLDEYLNFLTPIGVDLLYSAKPCTLDFVVRACAQRTAGIDVSSPGEAQLVREVLGEAVPLHFTSPGLSARNWDVVADVADYVNVNSLSMLAWLQANASNPRPRLGLRVNTGHSVAADTRYDPARPGSKLGVPRVLFEDWVNEVSDSPISGLHFHIGCESSSYGATIASLEWLMRVAAPLLASLEYVNIGGGWLRPTGMDGLDDFCAAIGKLRTCGVQSIFTEPGTGLIREAGLLVTRVTDVIDSGVGMVAVVDSHVGHAPETFEYDWAPDLYSPGNEVVTDGGYEYEVVGCTPLAGDIFGRYRFRRPLEIGQPFFFHLLGAYAFARAAPFTGVLLPSLYRITQAGELVTVKEPEFSFYRDLWRTNAIDFA
jgi:carboxynorspermidine decarboxylase